MPPQRQFVKPFNWIQWLTLLVALTTAVTVPILFTRIADVQAHQNDALRSIICRAVTVVHRTPVSATFTAEQKHKALRFYTQALTDAHLKPCR